MDLDSNLIDGVIITDKKIYQDDKGSILHMLRSDSDNFKEFEKRLLDIHSISKENYFSRLSKDKHYVMEYNEKISTIEILRKKIDLFLADELSDKKSAIENLTF